MMPTEENPIVGNLEDSSESNLATYSQWQLIRRNFAYHRLALISLFLLGILYCMAGLAEFVATGDPGKIEVDYIYCPPQSPQWSLSEGLHYQELTRQTDPISLKQYYTVTGSTVPLGFFVKGETYHLFGLIPWDRHLFGPSVLGADGEPIPYYFLGGDEYGRDVFSRLIYGSRISLSIGLFSIVVTFLLGTVIGGISGYVGGRVDNMIQRLIEVINSFPHLPLWLAFAAVVPGDWSPLKTYFAITILLSLLAWTGLARVVRGKILSLREEDYAVAARLLGAGDGRVLFRHLLPGFTSHIIVSLSLSVPAMILAETTLSFLGLGLRPPVVWGVMLQEAMNIDVVANYPWLLLPVFMIIMTVMCFNFVGDGMRDAADPYASR
ncbi:ABC transporter permease [Coraliomargarita algicola]|uniref:ABC transporter permease n=1 Tax=Coraliomargarita algicola TaxID=3092156 RepID=A0ABZ0RK39_9BACT|nr:ABC transporter permease [Coraliomargarita sp. J2-16]WPJ95365.1 ABC transporter permease [Coraliomargarita sp. J2-16]